MAKNKKTGIIAGVVLLVLVAAFLVIYSTFSKKTVEGSKTIGITILHADETKKELEFKTDQEYLSGALEEYDENLLIGRETQYGLMIDTVDGYTADESKQEWWGIYQNNEMTPNGIDTTPIADGEKYEIRLNVGYDAY